MKNAVTTLLFTATVIFSMVTAGCKQQEISDDMSDSVKLTILDAGIEKHPKDAGLLASRAQVLLNLHRTEEALFDIDRALERDPDNVRYLLLKSDICFAGGNIQESLRTLETTERLAPRSREVQLKLGEITFYGRDYERSLKHLSNVTADDPNNRTALFMKGFVYKEMGDTGSAVQLLRRVCDRFPDNAAAFEQLGILYAARGENLALEYLGTALELDPTNTNVIYALALFHQDRGDYDAAESLYRQLLDLNPQSADAWHNLGWIELTHYHDYAAAVRYFDRALEADPTLTNAQLNRQLALDEVDEVAGSR